MSYTKKQQHSAKISVTERLLDIMDTVVYRFRLGSHAGYDYISPSIKQLTGYTPEEIYEDPGISSKILPMDEKQLLKYFDSEKEQKKIYYQEIICKDKTVRKIERKEMPVFDSKGKLVAVEGVIKGITEQEDTEEALRESERRYRELTETTLTGIYIIQQGILVYSNLGLAYMLGYTHPEQIIGKPVTQFIIPEDHTLVHKELHLREKGEKNISHYEITLTRINGTHLPVEVLGQRSVYKGKVAVHGILLDITERKKIEKQFHIQSAALKNAANGIIITNTDGDIEWVNNAFTLITGYSRKEAIGKNPRILKSGEHSVDFYKNMWNTILKGEIWRNKIINQRKNGSPYTEELTIAPIFNKNGKITHFVGVQLDITQQEKTLKNLHIALERLHRLSNHLNKILEQERLEISRNLHDNLGQILTAVKMDFSWLTRKWTDASSEDKERLAETSTILDQALKTVRDITTELRPNILDELGLWDALEDLCQETTKRSGIKINMIFEHRDITLPENYILPVYRVVQEALTNIVRHSGATNAKLHIDRTPEKIIFSISDNGTGIPQKKLDSHENFGLIGMQERIEILGGEFEIPEHDDGTEILFNLPVPQIDKS